MQSYLNKKGGHYSVNQLTKEQLNILHHALGLYLVTAKFFGVPKLLLSQIEKMKNLIWGGL